MAPATRLAAVPCVAPLNAQWMRHSHLAFPSCPPCPPAAARLSVLAEHSASVGDLLALQPAVAEVLGFGRGGGAAEMDRSFRCALAVMVAVAPHLGVAVGDWLVDLSAAVSPAAPPCPLPPAFCISLTLLSPWTHITSQVPAHHQPMPRRRAQRGEWASRCRCRCCACCQACMCRLLLGTNHLRVSSHHEFFPAHLVCPPACRSCACRSPCPPSPPPGRPPSSATCSWRCCSPTCWPTTS